MTQLRNWLLSAVAVIFYLSLFAPTADGAVPTSPSASVIQVDASQDVQVATYCSPCVCTKYCKTRGTTEQSPSEQQAAIVRKCQPGDVKCTIQKYSSKDDVTVAVDRCPQNSPNCGGTRPTRNATASA